MTYTIESEHATLNEIANYIVRIDSLMARTPIEMTDEQTDKYLKVEYFLSKARAILKDIDAISSNMW